MELRIGELPSKKRGDNVLITYDDILAKLNVKIVEGRMQYITPVGTTNAHFAPSGAKSVSTSITPNVAKKGTKVNRPAIDPKMDYIYNKYFKDERTEVVKRPPPKTIEEYNQRLAHDLRLHAISQRETRMVKSKKLMMLSNANPLGITIADPNTLFSIKTRK
jgi:hypothetical protein